MRANKSRRYRNLVANVNQHNTHVGGINCLGLWISLFNQKYPKKKAKPIYCETVYLRTFRNSKSFHH